MNLKFEINKWFGFCGLLLLSYGISQGIGNHFFLVDEEKLTWRDNVQNIFMMLVLASSVFIFGNYQNTFPNPAFIVMLLVTPIAWTFLQRLFDTRHIGDVDDWSSNERKFNITLFSLVLIIFIYHMTLAKLESNKIFYSFLFYIILISVLFVVLYTTSTYADSYKKTFYIQYWMVGWFVAFFTRFNTIPSQLMAGFAIGLLVNGFSLFKDNLIFYSCREESYYRCNGGPLLCEKVGDRNDYNDANWYSIIIISIILSLLYFLKRVNYFTDFPTQT